MEKVVDLFYSKSRFKSKLIQIRQLIDLLLKELDNENLDLYIIFDYVYSIQTNTTVLYRWLKKLALEELEKKREIKENDKELSKGAGKK